MKYLVVTCCKCWQNVIYLPEVHQATVTCVHCGSDIRIWDPCRTQVREVQPL